MWGRKQEPPEQDSGPVAKAPSAAPPQSAAAPPSTATKAPAAAPRPDARERGQAWIGPSLKLRGEIAGNEDLVVDGQVEGTVDLSENSLTVGPKGNVRAHVKARSITVLGRLEGNVQAGERVEIRKTGMLEGDLSTPRIVIEDGAVFRGSIDILKPTEQHSAAPDKRSIGSETAAGPKSVTAAASESGPSAAKPKPLDLGKR